MGHTYEQWLLPHLLSALGALFAGVERLLRSSPTIHTRSLYDGKFMPRRVCEPICLPTFTGDGGGVG